MFQTTNQLRSWFQGAPTEANRNRMLLRVHEKLGELVKCHQHRLQTHESHVTSTALDPKDQRFSGSFTPEIYGHIWEIYGKYMGLSENRVYHGIPPNGLFLVGAAENDDNQRRMGPETTPHDDPPRF